MFGCSVGGRACGEASSSSSPAPGAAVSRRSWVPAVRPVDRLQVGFLPLAYFCAVVFGLSGRVPRGKEGSLFLCSGTLFGWPPVPGSPHRRWVVGRLPWVLPDLFAPGRGACGWWCRWLHHLGAVGLVRRVGRCRVAVRSFGWSGGRAAWLVGGRGRAVAAWPVVEARVVGLV